MKAEEFEIGKTYPYDQIEKFELMPNVEYKEYGPDYIGANAIHVRLWKDGEVEKDVWFIWEHQLNQAYFKCVLISNMAKKEIGFKDVDGNSLKENVIYNCHRFMYYMGAEIDCTCQAKVVYSSRMAAFGLKMIDGNFGHEIEDYENDVIPLCSIGGLHEESFTLFKIRQ